MKKQLLNMMFPCVAMGAVLSIGMLPLCSSYAVGQSAATAGATEKTSAPYQYWRTGNPGDAHTVTRAGFALIGGGKDLDEAFSWLCQRSGGGDFLVLRASGTDAYNPYVQALCHENSVATLLIPSRHAAFDPVVQKKIVSAEAIFISGGDQAKYVTYWQNTPVQHAINDAIGRGVPVGGTSAGLAVQGEFMYSAQNDPADGPDLNSAMALQNPYIPRVTIVRNFLNIPPLHDTITDTHFSRRDRMGRLLVFMARILQSDNVKNIRGIAVDEQTAVLLEKNGHGTVIGAGAVYFLETSSKAAVCRPQVPLSFEAISVIKSRAGDQFDTAKWIGSGTRYVLSAKQGAIHSTQAGGAVY